ncbi:MAG: NUDIX domain-containing protein [Verrucomicrobia bacterium]|jgi:8-oxo-dGTP diphosphatase|nr:NUDIX domain-containing protein [Verrucomicrobiota bacterium]
MGKSVEVIARGVCVKGGKVLLCQSKKAKIAYLPGGHTEFKETARTSLEREIVEELGLPSKAGRFLGAVEHSFKQRGKRHCEWNIVFALEIPTLELEKEVVAAEDHIMFWWCAIEELKQARIEPAVLCDLLPKWLDDAFVGERWGSGGDFA